MGRSLRSGIRLSFEHGLSAARRSRQNVFISPALPASGRRACWTATWLLASPIAAEAGDDPARAIVPVEAYRSVGLGRALRASRPRAASARASASTKAANRRSTGTATVLVAPTSKVPSRRMPGGAQPAGLLVLHDELLGPPVAEAVRAGQPVGDLAVRTARAPQASSTSNHSAYPDRSRVESPPRTFADRLARSVAFMLLSVSRPRHRRLSQGCRSRGPVSTTGEGQSNPDGGTDEIPDSDLPATPDRARPGRHSPRSSRPRACGLRGAQREPRRIGRADRDRGARGSRRPRASSVNDGKVMTSDGPFAEVKEQLAGFYLVECEGMDRACEIAAPDSGGGAARHGSRCDRSSTSADWRCRRCPRRDRGPAPRARSAGPRRARPALS